MNVGVPLGTKDSTVVITREGVHWLAFLVAFGMAFAAGVIGLFLGAFLFGSISYLPWWEPWWEWVPVVMISTALGALMTFAFVDKISISSEGLIVFRLRKAKSYHWSNFAGIRETLAFGDVVLTFAHNGYYGEAISRSMAKTVLEHPSCPKGWYLPPGVLEYIHTGRVPKRVSWIGGIPTAEQDRADRSQPVYYRQERRAMWKSWIGLTFSILALLLLIITLLYIH